MTAARLQEVPLNVNALAPLSTAAQKPGDEHETDAIPVSAPAAGSSMLRAGLHLVPLKARTDVSRASTARQKLTVGHDTESGSPSDEGSRVGRLHVVPS
jgi:hypothetical protein